MGGIEAEAPGSLTNGLGIGMGISAMNSRGFHHVIHQDSVWWFLIKPIRVNQQKGGIHDPTFGLYHLRHQMQSDNFWDFEPAKIRILAILAILVIT